MSVRSDLRSTSPMEFINTARELYKKTILRTASMGKSFTFSLRNPLCDLAREVFLAVNIANANYPDPTASDKNNYNTVVQSRRHHQTIAWSNLVAFEQLLIVASELTEISGLGELTALLSNEKKYLRGWIESDKVRFM